MKQQDKCYRNINGKKYINFADLIYSDQENEKVIGEAKSKYQSIRQIKHPDGYKQLFVA